MRIGLCTMTRCVLKTAVPTGSSLLLLLAACGGGGTSSTPPTPPTSPSITSVAVSPNPATITIGGTQQFTATVSGSGSISQGVTWAVFAPSTSTLSPGTMTSSGFYTTPYPAPDTLTVVATSTEDKTKSGSVTVTLSPPATTAGPSLTVDAGNPTHAISPYIYGMNAYLLDSATTKASGISIDRWGGD